MVRFKEILDYCQAEAIANKMAPNEESMYRGLCRSYSKMFHTPLDLVEAMPPEHVILHVYEEQIEALDDTKFENLENMLETVLGIRNPNYDKEKETKLSKDIEKYEREEEERLKAGRLVHPSLKNKTPKKTLPENEANPEETKPTGGSAKLDGLNEDNES